MTEVVASVADVHKSYGQVPALRGVSFSVSPGIVVLIGPNGAGKTTTLRMLATLLTPDTGRIELFGEPLRANALREVRRNIGYMPQESGLYKSFTVREFLVYMATLKEIPPSRMSYQVDVAVEAVGLGDVRDRKVGALSGGMKRRLLLAQALLRGPKLLILDEPTAGLDPEQRYRLLELLSEAARDTVLLVSTHQTEGIGGLASKLIVMLDGVVVFNGTGEELVNQARGRVWESSDRSASALVAMRTEAGSYRCIGDPPSHAKLLEPQIDDAYLLLTHAA